MICTPFMCAMRVIKSLPSSVLINFPKCTPKIVNVNRPDFNFGECRVSYIGFDEIPTKWTFKLTADPRHNGTQRPSNVKYKIQPAEWLVAGESVNFDHGALAKLSKTTKNVSIGVRPDASVLLQRARVEHAEKQFIRYKFISMAPCRMDGSEACELFGEILAMQSRLSYYVLVRVFYANTKAKPKTPDGVRTLCT